MAFKATTKYETLLKDFDLKNKHVIIDHELLFRRKINFDIFKMLILIIFLQILNPHPMIDSYNIVEM